MTIDVGNMSHPGSAAMRAALRRSGEATRDPQRARVLAYAGPPRTTTPVDDVSISVHESVSAIEAEWRTFAQQADCTVFQLPDWLATWQRHIGAPAGVQPAIVIGRDVDGSILFILPLAVASSGFARELTWLGSDLCDYNAPLLARHFSERIAPEQFAPLWLRRIMRGCCGSIRDGGLMSSASEKDAVAAVGAQANPAFLSLRMRLHHPLSSAHATPLDESWDTFYMRKRSSVTRRRDRTKRKRLSEIGKVEFKTHRDAPEVLAALDVLMAQKSRAFAKMGVANLFARAGYRGFYQALGAGLLSEDLVHISTVSVGDTVAAANFGLIFRGRYYHILASYSDCELSRFGPGALHQRELLNYANERGCKIFDFTNGDERYKLEWCDTADALHDHFALVGWRGSFAYLRSTMVRASKRLIKGSPMLWKACRTARAMIGRTPLAAARRDDDDQPGSGSSAH